MSQPHRKAALNLYKTLLFLGRDWPQGYDLFRKRLHKVFQKNSGETDPEKIQTMIKHGEFVVKEIEALYKLKKYRTLKRSLPHIVTGIAVQWCGLHFSYKFYDPSCTRSKNLYEECGPLCCAQSQCV